MTNSQTLKSDLLTDCHRRPGSGADAGAGAPLRRRRRGTGRAAAAPAAAPRPEPPRQPAMRRWPRRSDADSARAAPPLARPASAPMPPAPPAPPAARFRTPSMCAQTHAGHAIQDRCRARTRPSECGSISTIRSRFDTSDVQVKIDAAMEKAQRMKFEFAIERNAMPRIAAEEMAMADKFGQFAFAPQVAMPIRRCRRPRCRTSA